MKHLLFNTIIFVLITLLGIILLTLTHSSAIEFKDMGTDRNEDSMIITSANVSIEPYKLDVDYINFKSYTMYQIEKNNQDIIKITEEINETERSFEEARNRRINNLKKQNTQLNAGLNSYQTNTNGWESFKSNFSTNFKRMGLPFSELFKGSSIQ